MHHILHKYILVFPALHDILLLMDTSTPTALPAGGGVPGTLYGTMILDYLVQYHSGESSSVDV